MMLVYLQIQSYFKRAKRILAAILRQVNSWCGCTFAYTGRSCLSSDALADETLCTAQQFIKCSKHLQLQIEQSLNGGRKCFWVS